MADFTGNQIRRTYQRLLQLDNFITQNGTGSINLDKVHISGSVYVTGSQVISKNLRVLGNVTAQQFIATTVSSSIVYESGSSRFGNSLDDEHVFTGSLKITGSANLQVDELTLNGRFRHTGSLIHSGTVDIDTTGNITLSGSIAHSGDITHSGNVNRTGNTVLNGVTTLSGSTAITGSTALDTDVTITKLNLTGNIVQTGGYSLTGSLNHFGSLNRVGNSVLTGSILHSGSNVTEGQLDAQEGAFGAFFANPQTINNNTSIPSNYNSRLFGPITVALGKTLTVGVNSKLEIIDI